MKIEATPLQDCFIIHDTVHGDARGYFIETFNQKILMQPLDWIWFLYKTINLDQAKVF